MRYYFKVKLSDFFHMLKVVRVERKVKKNGLEIPTFCAMLVAILLNQNTFSQSKCLLQNSNAVTILHCAFISNNYSKLFNVNLAELDYDAKIEVVALSNFVNLFESETEEQLVRIVNIEKREITIAENAVNFAKVVRKLPKCSSSLKIVFSDKQLNYNHFFTSDFCLTNMNVKDLFTANGLLSLQSKILEGYLNFKKINSAKFYKIPHYSRNRYFSLFSRPPPSHFI